MKTIPHVRNLHGDKNGFLSYLLSNTKGRVFSVTFKKKSGEIRTANGRTFIKGSVNGHGSSRPYAFIDNNVYLNLLKQGYEKHEAAIRSWRSFDPDRVVSFQTAGEKYEFV